MYTENYKNILVVMRTLFVGSKTKNNTVFSWATRTQIKMGKNVYSLFPIVFFYEYEQNNWDPIRLTHQFERLIYLCKIAIISIQNNINSIESVLPIGFVKIYCGENILYMRKSMTMNFDKSNFFQHDR